MVTIYHHNDTDGYASAATLKFLTQSIIRDCIPVDYQVTVEDSMKKYKCVDSERDIVFIVDYSFKLNTIHELEYALENSSIVYWIDHHASSVELIMTREFEALHKKYKDKFFYFVNKEFCGAMLTNFFLKAVEFIQNYEMTLEAIWDIDILKDIDNIADSIEGKNVINLDYIISNSMGNYNYFQILQEVCSVITLRYREKYTPITDDMERDIKDGLHGTNMTYLPKGISCIMYYVDLWDTFKDERFHNVIPLVYGTNNYGVYDWKDAFSNDTAKDFLDKALAIGQPIYDNECIKNNQSVESYGFEFTYMGVKMLCLNETGNSLIFGDKYDDYDAVCLFKYNGRTNRWKYSFFSKNTGADCKELAESLGGGGHIHAAGAVTPRFIFSEIENEGGGETFVTGE